ncbi:RING finger protein 32-like [Thraustotheca clavata]|uniref:RING finger protein 32-like n=1 Tax=Thraustotheca clavata TaxID=74557 RepID=A0A1V9Y8L0_9STRA|nr:RING finger protein 32-like [Thraustotheca clavata]
MRSLNLRMTPPRMKAMKKIDCPTNQINEYRQVWVCDACTYENEIDAIRCGACKSFKPNNRRLKLTLAQKKGLVACPEPKLSINQWEECEFQAEERGDPAYPCSICREPFGVLPKVILSCSHMFHHNCLTSFERFLRTNARVCPLCRKQNYQKKLTKRGELHYKKACAIKMQAFVRGFLTRQHYPELLNQYYKQGYGDPKRRALFYASKISSISSRIVRAMDSRADSIDALLAQFDQTVILSRSVFNPTEAIDTKCQTSDKWASALLKATTREENECPICINAIDSKPMMLLNCSHVFHTDCLNAFESFNIYEVHLCPVCRCNYECRALQCDKPWTFSM